MTGFEDIVVQLIFGLSVGMLYWIVASGLTFIFGVTRILNFAHGAFYMLGAYFTITFFTISQNYVISVLFSAFLVGLIGMICERTLISRTYEIPLPFQLLLTFGLVLIFNDVVKIFWGLVPRLLPSPIPGSIEILNRSLPYYSIILIICGSIVALLIYFLLYRTSWGLEVRALVSNHRAAVCCGLNPNSLYATSFMFGSFLAGLGGALSLMVSTASPGMGDLIIVHAFIVTVIGGLGSLSGALLAALSLGVVESFGTLLIPWLTLALPYMLLVVVLLLRPEGIFGTR